MFNPDRGNNLIARGYSSGEVAMLPNVPTLADVAMKFGENVVVKWLGIQLDSVNNLQGLASYTVTARDTVASLIFSAYSKFNIGELLMFFARFKLGYYNDIVARVGGLQKITAALHHYHRTRNEDIIRIYRNAEFLRKDAERDRWKENAITYEEYLKQKK